jgi:hypothetical protein
MPDILVSVYCDKCGGELTCKDKYDIDKWGINIRALPCESCLKEARDDGYDAGADEYGNQ